MPEFAEICSKEAREMIRITPGQVTGAVRLLFRDDEMQAARCLAVLDGVVSGGKIIVDALPDPRWGIVQEAVDNGLFLGGDVDVPAFAALFAALRREGDVLIGMPPDDHRLAWFPPDAYYDNRVLEFYDRPVGEGLEHLIRAVPAGCVIRRLDRDLILRTEWGPGDVAFYGGLERWEKTCFGYAVMRGDEILSEATVGPSARGCYEPGVFTQESQRGQGYGTLAAARLVQEIETRGGRTYWNCTIQNEGSIGIAHNLGYRSMKEFRCLAWRQADQP
jgi:hypothetical protein